MPELTNFDRALVQRGLTQADAVILAVVRRRPEKSLSVAEALFREVVLEQCTDSLLPDDWDDGAAGSLGTRLPSTATGEKTISGLIRDERLTIDDFFVDRMHADVELAKVDRKAGWSIIASELSKPGSRANNLLTELERNGMTLVRDRDRRVPFDAAVASIAVVGCALVVVPTFSLLDGTQGGWFELVQLVPFLAGTCVVEIWRFWRRGHAPQSMVWNGAGILALAGASHLFAPSSTLSMPDLALVVGGAVLVLFAGLRARLL
jgi:hypothetical protein